MNHPLPKDKITSLSYTRKIEGFDIEFELTVTLLGEVLAVTCPILDLPPAAQKLMLGGNYQVISTATKGFSGVFSYAVPLIAMGYLDTEEWHPIKEVLTTFKKNRSVPSPKVQYIQQAWVKKAYQLADDGDPKRQLIQVSKLLTEESQKRYAAVVDYNKSTELNYYDPSFFGPVLLRLLPISKRTATLRGVYKSIATYPSETNYLLLTSRLTNMDYKDYHKAILAGLQPFRKATLQPILSTYFNNKPSLGGDELKLFIATAVQLPDPNRKELLYEVLASENRQAARQAYQQLRELGMTDQSMTQQLYPTFLKRQSLPSIRAILKLYNQVKDTSLLPSGQELIDTLQWANKEKKALGINQDITPILKKRLDKKGFTKLLDLLKTDNYNLQEAVVKQVLDLGNTQHVATLDKVAQTLPAPFNAQMINLTKRLLDRYSQRDPIDPLVTLLSSTKQLKIETLKTIRRVLSYRQSKVAIPPLLKELEHKNPDVRKYTLLALRIFKDKPVVKAIKELLQQEEHPIVRKTAQKCLDWIANPQPESRKIEREIKEQREIYLEEMIATSEQENGRPLPGISRFAIKLFGRMYYSYFPKDEWKE